MSATVTYLRGERDWYAVLIAKQAIRGVQPDPSDVEKFQEADSLLRERLGIPGTSCL